MKSEKIETDKNLSRIEYLLIFVCMLMILLLIGVFYLDFKKIHAEEIQEIKMHKMERTTDMIEVLRTKFTIKGERSNFTATTESLDER